MSLSQNKMSAMCALCGGASNGSRYGVVACLGCNVFFRRAVQDAKLGGCEKNCGMGNIQILKNMCRSCRLRSCLDAGMNPNAIRQRDKLGPRKPKLLMSSAFIRTNHDFDSLLVLQKKQRNLHKKQASTKINTGESIVMMKQKLYRRAGSLDINIVLKIGFQNAIEWANQFESYWNLKVREKRLILSEFGVSFALVDQAFKTVSMGDKGFWLLQNDSFLNADYFLAVSAKDALREDRHFQATNHFEFVTVLLNQIRAPFSSLQIDKFECVILKILLLLTPSFPGKVKIEDSEKMIATCMTELMSYCTTKSSRKGVERVGEIILLMRSIRCAVKYFYNQTKISSLFNPLEFDSYVRGSLLT